LNLGQPLTAGHCGSPAPAQDPAPGQRAPGEDPCLAPETPPGQLDEAVRRPGAAFITASAFAAPGGQLDGGDGVGAAGVRRSPQRSSQPEEEDADTELCRGQDVAEEAACRCGGGGGVGSLANGEVSGHNGTAEGPGGAGWECVNGQCRPGTGSGGPEEPYRHGMSAAQPGQPNGFPLRSAKQGGQSNAQHPSQGKAAQDKVNPDTVRTLPGTLDSPHRTRKRSKNTPKMSNTLEVALQEAMMELDQITANASQRTPKVKLRKPLRSKQRKVIR
ncbi:uncharacterized protein LOC144678113, partial [Cetorhinus maximus]